MRYKILKITGFLTCIMIVLSIYFGIRYYRDSSLVSEKKRIKDFMHKIQREKEIIKDKSKQIEAIKEQNKDKYSLLETWEKEAKKLNN